ncbi:MAG TPA: PspC domain-containing protein [Candidatus Paceibacterota bacterium]|nr:PspC domain-containing protein [Candidatus Paceibacterota bacterium]
MEQGSPVRKLYRSEKDKVLGGVCGGLGEYFSIDPVIIRVLFVLLTIPGGGGLIAYIILYFLIPPAPGEGAEDASVPDLGKRVKAAAEEFRTHAEHFAEEARTARANRSARREERRRVFGIVLVLVGGFALLDAIFPMSWFSWHFFWPLLIIGFGAYLVARSADKNKQKKEEDHG